VPLNPGVTKVEQNDSHRLGISDDYFVPAASLPEAISRIYGVTGRTGGTRGEKRALIALRDALDLDVDIVRTNAVLGERLAASLSVDWDTQRFTERNKLTLAGVNALLQGAVRAFRSGRLQPPKPVTPPALADFQWASFHPASSKLEAVNRIADLTNAPAEHLGPGGKEHRSVLENLADRALPEARLDRGSKTRLAKSLAEHFDVLWTDTCASTGETISLEGLNTILAGAERHLGVLGTSGANGKKDAHREAGLLANALRDGWTSQAWEGRTTVEWLRANNARGANDNEWQGFYFEYRARQILADAVGPTSSAPRVRYGNTTFDFARDFVWDLKAHTAAKTLPQTAKRKKQQSWCILNSEDAVRDCVEEQGLGFVILSGDAIMDEDGAFVSWHREFKAGARSTTAPSNSGKSRMRKSAFAPLRLDIFWISGTHALAEAIAAGVMRVQGQGRQAPKIYGQSGASRTTKFHMDVVGARSILLAESRGWATA
jgi:hypothetical protein